MGFSISVSVRSQRLKEDMLSFLLELYRPWSELAQGEDVPDHFQGPFVDDQLEQPGKCCIGFDYTPISGPEREYHLAIMRWVAIQVGKRRSKFRGEGLGLSSPVTYLVYDGIEAFPILLQSEWPKVPDDLQGYVCDSLGMKVDDSVAREMAWYFLPQGVFEKVSATLHGKSSNEVREALVQEGLQGAQDMLQGIRSQIARLDVLWKDRKPSG